MAEPRNEEALKTEQSHEKKHYFRLQRVGITLEAMQAHRTREGKGVPSQLSANEPFGGAWDAFDDEEGEIVVMEGEERGKLYDGVLLHPTRILARFSKGFFEQHLDEIATNYEVW